jgi:hypothetical protein
MSHALALASAVSLACLINPGGASPLGMYTSINLSLFGLLNSGSSSSLESSSGVWTSIDSYGVFLLESPSLQEETYLALLSSEEGEQELMIIQLDVIVLRIPPVNLSFNLVSIVIEDE